MNLRATQYDETAVSRHQDVAMRTALACLLLACVSLQGAQAAESRYTSIENKVCRFDPVGDEPGDSDDQLKTCPGLGGTQVLVNPFHAMLRIGFAWPGKPKVDIALPVVTAWSAGQKVEWRGVTTKKGFQPYAATVRMLYREDGKPGEQQVLAVMRVKRGEACLIGAVDIRANPNGYELARELADTAPQFDCKTGKARIVGVETEWAKNLVAEEDPYGAKRAR
jgi:hypothetical protein